MIRIMITNAEGHKLVICVDLLEFDTVHVGDANEEKQGLLMTFNGETDPSWFLERSETQALYDLEQALFKGYVDLSDGGRCTRDFTEIED